jgi:UDP-N-acetylmuramate dehydrogenase
MAIQPAAGVPLAPLTTLGIGGAAQWFLRATTAQDVADAHGWSERARLPMFILGGGSNVVIADAGIPGLVVTMAIGGTDFRRSGDDTIVSAGAGVPWDPLVQETVHRGLAGVECLSGIPGSVGGTPIQNVGAYGQDVSGVIQDVTVFDRASRKVVVIAGADCGFGYRMSRFKHRDASRFVVCGVTFRLRPGVPTVTYPDVVRLLQQKAGRTLTVGDVREAVLTTRRRKGMVLDPSDPDTRSVGSFFTNPIVEAGIHARLASASGEPVPGFAAAAGQVKMSAAWLIERAGYARGHRAGRVGLSSKHPLAIVNRGGGTARDVLDLASQIKRAVVDRFGIWLVPEPVFVGLDGDPAVAYLGQRCP